MKRRERQALLNKVAHLQHEAELGDIGIRELGERLVAVEAVAQGQAGAGHPRQVGGGCERAGGRGDQGAAKEGELLGRSQQPHGGKATSRHRQRLRALSAPVGPAAAACALARRRLRGATASEGVGHVTDNGVEAVVISRDGGPGSAAAAGGKRVVAVVKRPSKRWNSMLGCYPGGSPA